VAGVTPVDHLLQGFSKVPREIAFIDITLAVFNPRISLITRHSDNFVDIK
jgi:hypothetical protein